MPDTVQDYVFFILIGGLASGFFFAMFFQAFYNWLNGKAFDIFNAGLTVMGGLVGGASCFLILYFLIGKFYFKGKKAGLHIKHFNTLIRVAPVCIVVAHGFGRLGCLMSGCCHGQYLGQEYQFGGIWMMGTVNNMHKWGYYVPTQLYEALFLFALFAVLSILYFKRCNIIMSIYLIAYAVWRMFIEFFRTDARGAIILGLAPSQWQSILFTLLGVGILVFYFIKKIPFFLPKVEEVGVEETSASVTSSDNENKDD
jgi:phosphatidylglycerol:prolipoprotein diacylglycerol transferase